MLEYLRNASDKPLTKLLMVVLIFSFVGWGVASWIFGQTQTDDSILRVGGEKLKIAAFDNERGRLLTRMDRAEQKQIYSNPRMLAEFSEQILSSMASRMMMDVRANDLGLYVSNSEIATIIRNTPEFAINGTFDPSRFNMVLSSIGMNEDYYATMLRTDILRGMLFDAITPKLPVPEFSVTAMYNARYASRKIEYKTEKFSNFKVSGKPDDEALKKLHSQNPTMIPEFRRINYVLVPVAKMTAPDSYEVGYASAQKLEDMLIGGENMDSAAKKIKGKFVSLPAIDSHSVNHKGAKVKDSIISDETLARAFSMDSGIESEIIETAKGFMIMRVEEIETAHAAPLQEVREKLSKKWTLEEQKKQAYIAANSALVDLNAGKKPAMTSANVTRTDGAPTDILVAAFNSPVGTKMIVPGRDAYYVLSVVNETKPSVDSKKSAAIKSEMKTMLTRAVSDDYAGFLKSEYPIKVNERVYKKLFPTQQ